MWSFVSASREGAPHPPLRLPVALVLPPIYGDLLQCRAAVDERFSPGGSCSVAVRESAYIFKLTFPFSAKRSTRLCSGPFQGSTGAVGVGTQRCTSQPTQSQRQLPSFPVRHYDGEMLCHRCRRRKLRASNTCRTR